MTSREDLLNAISLNSSIVNGARVVGPSVAGLLIGAVGVATCFFLNGVTFVAVIAGLLMMRLPPLKRPAHAVSAGEHAWNGIVYSMKHQRVRTILLLFLAVASSAGPMPCSCRPSRGMCLGRGANGYGVLMSSSGTGALIGALVVATYGHLLHRDDLRSVVSGYFRSHCSRFFFEPKFLSRACISTGCRIWHAPVFLDVEHRAANDCAG